MRWTFVAAVVLAATAATSSPAAAAYEYPWCAHYGGRIGATNCGFVSFRQCMATVSGIGGYCAENPFYVAMTRSAPTERTIKKRKRVRYYYD